MVCCAVVLDGVGLGGLWILNGGLFVQEAALRACLEGQTAKTESAWRSPRLGNGQSRYRPRLVTSHRRKKGRKTIRPFYRHIISRGLYRKMLPHAGEFRPISALRASLRSVALRNAPAGAVRRATRRCSPWTRTGLMSGDRKANRYLSWRLLPVLRRQVRRIPQSVKGRGIVSPCTRSDSRHSLSPRTPLSREAAGRVRQRPSGRREAAGRV